MDKQPSPLILISDVAARRCVPVVDSLARAGYVARVVCDGGVAEADRPAHEAVAYYFGPEGSPASASRLVQAFGGGASLGIFHRPGSLRELELLDMCTDFVTWPCTDEELRHRLDRVCSVNPGQSGDDTFAALNLEGRSPVFTQVLAMIRRVAGCDAPVLVQGETGTGKELAARAIHYLGPRRDFPFIPVNCGSIPDNLFENELFGHEKGAFTDARDAQPGLVTQANFGTLFLDEVETLSPKGQVALLRFLQNREYRPLGARSLRQADVRVVAASNADLHALSAQGLFRADLLFRLDIVSLRMPALRERAGDVEVLARMFVERYSGAYGVPAKVLHPQTLAWMNAYRWPGNIRELENFVHRAVLVTDGPAIHLSPQGAEMPGVCDDGAARPPAALSFSQAKAKAISDFERDYLTALLADAGGNVTLAARRAGKERRALGKLLKKHNIERGQFLAGR